MSAENQSPQDVESHSPKDRAVEEIYSCPECAAGLMRLDHITYFTWLNHEFITVPNFPAWVCDVCGRREFDPRAVTWLNTLLNPSAGRSLKRKARPKSGPRPANRPQP
jgi:YgiT-type zinc finger domain-containing protein